MLYRHLLLLSILCISFVSCSKKEGCTDEQAANFSEAAEQNDGSCDYSTTFTQRQGLLSGNSISYITIQDRGEGLGNFEFTPDKVWVLDGWVYVNAPDTLKIEPGTVIMGDNANSGLVIRPGAVIEAMGTVGQPIIFTAKADVNLDLDVSVKGQWGGLVIMGNGLLEEGVLSGELDFLASGKKNFGGNVADDFSGRLDYVSVRHAGGNGAAVTFAGVGSSSIFQNIEVIASGGGAVSIFGGAPKIKQVISAVNSGFGMQLAMGTQMKGQFILQYNEGASAGLFISDQGVSANGFVPELYNVTSIGSGSGTGVIVRGLTGLQLYNAVFTEWNNGVSVEKLLGNSAADHIGGRIRFENNSFHQLDKDSVNFAFTLDVGEGVGEETVSQILTNWHSSFQPNGNSTVNTGVEQSDVATNEDYPVSMPPNNGFYDFVRTRGAVSEGNWFYNWTKTHQLKILE